jgi:hypothetical protein
VRGEEGGMKSLGVDEAWYDSDILGWCFDGSDTGVWSIIEKTERIPISALEACEAIQHWRHRHERSDSTIGCIGYERSRIQGPCRDRKIILGTMP